MNLKTTTAVLFVAGFLAGCATTPRPKPAAAQQAVCQQQPQWTMPDPQGRTLGIYVCFGENNQLQYSVRVLPPAAPAPRAPVPPAPVKKQDAKFGTGNIQRQARQLKREIDAARSEQEKNLRIVNEQIKQRHAQERAFNAAAEAERP